MSLYFCETYSTLPSGELWYSDSGRKEFAAAEKELAGEAGEMRDIFAIE